MRTALLAVFVCVSSSVHSQETTPTIRVSTRLVVLDVRVVDAKGRLVTNLDRSQFTVFEDKVQQTIRDFEKPDEHTAPPGSPEVHSTADLARRGNAPVNVLVIDELNTAFGDTARAQEATRHFLESQPDVLPVPTLFLAAGASRLTLLHDFTQSRNDLLASLKGHHTDIDGRALTNQLAGGTMSAPDGFAKTLGALSQLASSLRGIRGHKNVIWVGAGFDQAYDLTSAGDQDEQKIADALKLVTERMMDARISLSTIDPKGMDADEPEENIDAESQLDASGPNDLSNFAQQASFDSLAESTGGTVVKGRNDLAHLIHDDAEAANSFYTLTYSPTNTSTAAAEFRSIRVVMRDPSLHAFTRTGYFPGEETEAAPNVDTPRSESREFKFDLLSAGGSHMVYTGLSVSAKAMDGGYKVLVQAGGLHWTEENDGTRVAEVSIVAAAFDRKDKTVLQQARELKERIRSTDSLTGTAVGFAVPLNVPPTAVRLRFVVRDAASGAIGSADVPLQ